MRVHVCLSGFFIEFVCVCRTFTPSACAWRMCAALPALWPLPDDLTLVTLPELPTLLRSPPVTHTHTHTHTDTRTHTHMHARTHTHAQTHAFAHACNRPNDMRRFCAYKTHTCNKQMDAYSHANTHARTHTHRHTHIEWFSWYPKQRGNRCDSPLKCTGQHVVGWTGRTDGQTDRRTDGRTDRQGDGRLSDRHCGVNKTYLTLLYTNTHTQHTQAHTAHIFSLAFPLPLS